jgi:hypothetical protein
LSRCLFVVSCCMDLAMPRNATADPKM